MKTINKKQIELGYQYSQEFKQNNSSVSIYKECKVYHVQGFNKGKHFKLSFDYYTDAKTLYRNFVNNQPKQYVFIYEDKQGNELTRETIEADNIQEARKYAKNICFNSMLNDLHKIRVKRIY
jgi:hypothetical protein